MIEQAKFTYSPLGKALEKQTKTIESQGENQIKAIEKHRKQLAKSNKFVKCSLPLEIFENLVDERIEEMKELHESIDFENLIYHFKGENADIEFNDFIDAETFCNNLKSHKIKLDDVKKKTNRIKIKNVI